MYRSFATGTANESATGSLSTCRAKPYANHACIAKAANAEAATKPMTVRMRRRERSLLTGRERSFVFVSADMHANVARVVRFRHACSLLGANGARSPLVRSSHANAKRPPVRMRTGAGMSGSSLANPRGVRIAVRTVRSGSRLQRAGDRVSIVVRHGGHVGVSVLPGVDQSDATVLDDDLRGGRRAQLDGLRLEHDRVSLGVVSVDRAQRM